MFGLAVRANWPKRWASSPFAKAALFLVMILPILAIPANSCVAQTIRHESKVRVFYLTIPEPISPILSSDVTSAEAVRSSKLQKIGVELKGNLKKYYRIMHVTTALLERPNSAVDVTKIVADVIPKGTSFDDAETILRDAGFKIYPGPWSQYAPDGSSVLAVISPFEQGFTWRSDLIVALAPKFKNRYDFVGDLSANFTLASL